MKRPDTSQDFLFLEVQLFFVGDIEMKKHTQRQKLQELRQKFGCNRLPNSQRCQKKQQQGGCSGCTGGQCYSKQSILFVQEVRAIQWHNPQTKRDLQRRSICAHKVLVIERVTFSFISEGCLTIGALFYFSWYKNAPTMSKRFRIVLLVHSTFRARRVILCNPFLWHCERTDNHRLQ